VSETVGVGLLSPLPIAHPPFPRLTTYDIWFNSTFEAVLSVEEQSRRVRELKLGTALSDYDTSGGTAAVQAAVDAAIIGLRAGSASSADIEVTLDRFEDIGAGDARTSVVKTYGITFILLALTVQSLTVLMTISAERDSNLLETMRRMGLVELSYWVAWLLPYLALSVFSAVVFLLVGRGVGLNLFTKVHY